MSDPERIDALIERQRRGWPKRARSSSALAGELGEAWRAAVGPSVAANSAPARMAGDVLVVACASATWAGELTLLQATVLAGLRAALGPGAPAGLRFVVGELPAAAPTPRVAAPPRAPSAADEGAARAVAAGVEDPVLRAAVERALGAALAREGHGGGCPAAGADRPL